MQEAEDFRAESRALHTILAGTNADRFEERTQFKDWTINDVLQHIHFWNEMATCQIEDEARLKKTLKSAMASKGGLRPFEREALGDPKGTDLLDAWKEGFERTADTFAASDPKARLVWAGPTHRRLPGRGPRFPSGER